SPVCSPTDTAHLSLKSRQGGIQQQHNIKCQSQLLCINSPPPGIPPPTATFAD
ncbi:hypothetical protein ILYODFUR_012917, partial [Ilyodon furcidens]